MDRLIAFKQPYLARKSKEQLLMQSVFFYTFIDFGLSKDSREAVNFILGYCIDFTHAFIHHYLITTKK